MERTTAESVGLQAILSGEDWANIRTWYRRYGRHNLPWRAKAEPWNVLLAEVLLHRTRASAVEALYDEILNQFQSPEAITQRPIEWLEVTRPLGLAWRAQVFITACERLVSLHQNEVPAGLLTLVSLPGIGHYVASAVRCFAFGIPEAIVDTNTIRLASRITREPLSPTRHRSRRVRQAVARLAEDGTACNAQDNYALLDLAASVCRAVKPACKRCTVASGCATGRRSLAEFALAGEN